MVKRTSWLGRRRTLHLAALLVVALTSWRIWQTQTRLSHTVDEPTHISSGLEWIESGTQRLHPENPPLGRFSVGIAAWLSGHSLPDTGTAPQRGTELLYAEGAYLENLRGARLGTLPWFLLTVLLVWNWAQQIAGSRAGLLAAVSVATLPPLLGHAGLATTDVPFAAAFVLLCWVYVGWLEEPRPRNSLWLGLTLGLAIATKYSTLIFFPPAALAIFVAWRFADRAEGTAAEPRHRQPPQPNWAGIALGVGLAIPVSALVVWTAFRFDIGRVDEIAGAERAIEIAFPDDEGLGRRLVDAVSHRPVPAPDAIHGIIFLKAHANLGHPAYLFGRRSQDGFWNFYPVALAVKSPLSFALLFGLALAGLSRQSSLRRWRSLAPAVAALVVLVVSMTSTVNIGLRHVLVVYPLLAVTLGLGLDALLERPGPSRRRIVAGVTGLLLLWQVLLVVRAFPDYLAWFNPLAGDEPGRILVDSDLDWGQDALALEQVAEELGISQLAIAYFGSVRLCELDLPDLRWLPPGESAHGWIAVSEMYYRGHWRTLYGDACDRTSGSGQAAEGLSYDWLRAHEPVVVAGRSIRLYNIDADPAADGD